jgi:hypothetical protein
MTTIICNAGASPHTSYVPLKVWEGYVTEVDEVAGTFRAELVERSAQPPSQPLAVEMDIQEVLEDDRDLMIPGAVFYWTIGRARDAHGRVTNYDDIRFRRLPNWTNTRIRRLQTESAKLFAFLQGSAGVGLGGV